MKKNLLRSALLLSAMAVLLALAGCDSPVEEPVGAGNWLVKEQNPFIGTWGYSSTGMSGVVTTTELEFKTDGTITTSTTTNDSTTTSTTTSTQYYLIKDNFIVISGTGNTVYTKYRFEVRDNNTIALVANGNPTVYTRVGAENPSVSRNFNLLNGLEGYWRRDTVTAASTMYDWYTFNENGTYRVYHYMNQNKHYVDRGEFSYYIDGSDRLVTLNRLYDVTVYYDLTKIDDDAFSWAATSGGNALGFERFDGETFTK